MKKMLKTIGVIAIVAILSLSFSGTVNAIPTDPPGTTIPPPPPPPSK